MNLLLNILWIVLGGFAKAIEYIVSSVLMMVTIIGIPFGLQTLKLSAMALLPFGSSAIPSPDYMGGCLNLIMNVIWWFVGGIPIALTHLALGLVLCLTIVGIPFGIQHFKLMNLALFPFGKTVVLP